MGTFIGWDVYAHSALSEGAAGRHDRIRECPGDAPCLRRPPTEAHSSAVRGRRGRARGRPRLTGLLRLSEPAPSHHSGGLESSSWRIFSVPRVSYNPTPIRPAGGRVVLTRSVGKTGADHTSPGPRALRPAFTGLLPRPRPWAYDVIQERSFLSDTASAFRSPQPVRPAVRPGDAPREHPAGTHRTSPQPRTRRSTPHSPHEPMNQ